MDKERITLAADQMACVFLGKHQEETPGFKHHGQIAWISAETGQDVVEVVRKIPPNTKAIILTEGIPAPIYQRLTGEARSRHITYLHRKNPRALLGALRDLFPNGHGGGNGSTAGDTSPKQIAKRGEIQDLIASNPPKTHSGTADEARRLFAIAKERGIITTHASIAQAIRIFKRKHGTGDIPASARPANPFGGALQTLNDAIAGLEIMRDWVASVELENADMRAQLSDIKKRLGIT